MSDHNPDEYLPVESAGNVAGIPPRTLRYWIAGGKLPAIAGQRGKLVRLGDVLDLAAITGKSAMPSRQPAGNVGNSATSAGTTAGNIAGNDALIDASPAVPPAAMSQLEAVRDEWLQPLIDQIRSLEHARGRLEEQRDQAVRERDELRAEVELLRAIPRPADDMPQDQRRAPTVAQDATQPPESTSNTLHESSIVAGWLRRLFGRS